MAKKTILYIASFYRPVNSAPEIRASRLTEALLRTGWRVMVVTEGEPGQIETIHENLTIYSVSKGGCCPGVINENFSAACKKFRYCSDSTKAFLGGIYTVCQHLIKNEPVNLIFTTAPYFSLSKVGQLLADEFGLSWIMEMRDAWHTGMYWPYPSRRHQSVAAQWEGECIRRADRIITVTRTHQEILVEKYGAVVKDKVTTVRHSFDRYQVTPGVARPADKARKEFRLVHTGQLRGIDICAAGVWARLARGGWRAIRRLLFGASYCEKLRIEWMSPHLTLQAAGRLAGEMAAFSQEVVFEFVGAAYPQVDDWAEKCGLSGRVIQHGHLPPEQTQAIVDGADVLLLYLYGIDAMAYHWCVPTKLYTYLSTGKPILAPVPPGETVEILTRSGLGHVVPPWDVEAVYQALKALYHQHKTDGITVDPDWEYINQFDVSCQQRAFLDVVNTVI